MKKQDVNLILPVMLYLSASFADYFFTSQGILMGKISELNPLISLSMSLFGVHLGILLPKMFFGILVITLLIRINGRKFYNCKTFHAEYVLYAGALITLLIGVSWLL